MADSLRPAETDALAAWRARVVADKEQVERAREVEDPSDFYAPVTSRFRMDPRRTGDPTLDALLALALPDDVWLDVGAGGGRYALPLALAVREVFAIDPSPSMLAALRDDAAADGIENIRLIGSRWPMPDPPNGDVGLMAHVGYDIAEIGPFLDQLEAQSSRLCVSVMGKSAMTSVAGAFWERIHGEPRVRLPALPEFLVLLTAHGQLPEVTLVDRAPPTFDSDRPRRTAWRAASSGCARAATRISFCGSSSRTPSRRRTAASRSTGCRRRSASSAGHRERPAHEATPAPNQPRWMMGRAGALAVMAGVARGACCSVGCETDWHAASRHAFVMGILAGAVSFTVSHAVFWVTMPRHRSAYRGVPVARARWRRRVRRRAICSSPSAVRISEVRKGDWLHW